MRAPFVALALALAAFARPLAAQADPPAVAVARAALDNLGPSPCDDRAGDDVWSVRISLVVHPDGVWSLALGPVGAAVPLAPAHLEALRACADAALSGQLRPTLPSPPRAPAVLVREWRYTAASERIVLERLQSLRPAITACVRTRRPDARGDVALTIRAPVAGPPDVRPRAPSALSREVARCAAQALVATPALRAPLDAVLTLDAPPTRDLPRADGTRGAVCAWGMPFAPVGERLPDPAPCRAGLRCCPSGGAAGSGSVCTAAARCPMYP